MSARQVEEDRLAAATSFVVNSEHITIAVLDCPERFSAVAALIRQQHFTLREVHDDDIQQALEDELLTETSPEIDDLNRRAR